MKKVREKKLLISTLALVFLLGGLATAIQIKPAKALYTTRIYVNMGGAAYIPGVTAGLRFYVRVDVEFPAAWDKTALGVVGWGAYVTVDPTVLTPFGVYGAALGYYLYDWVDTNAMPANYPTILYTTNASTFIDVAEYIMGYKTLGIGAGGNSVTGPYGLTNGLAKLRYTSLSATAYTRIHISDAKWTTPDGIDHPFDVVDDGYYASAPPVPEFPLGIEALMAIAPAIPIIYLWRKRPKRRVTRL